MLPVLAVTAVIIVLFVARMEPLFSSVQQRLDRLNTVLQENIAGARLVKSFVRADFEGERFEAANEELTGRSVKVLQIMSSMSPTLTMCVNVGMVIVIWVGGIQCDPRGAHRRADRCLHELPPHHDDAAHHDDDPLEHLGRRESPRPGGSTRSSRPSPMCGTPRTRSPCPRQARGRIVFEKVSFHYSGGGRRERSGRDRPHCRSRVRPWPSSGRRVPGKSTLVNLVPRFYDVTAGRILVDGTDVRRLTQESLLARIAIVPQETVLFSGTVRDNIRYGVPGAGDDEVIEAARAAQAHEFITALSKGYDTRVEERGTNLSGGQRQRIAIARALLMRPMILILDDSTSSVDVETETRIQEALAAEAEGRTTLVVAQRISTVLKADRIVVLEKGRIAAQGTHAELMAASPIYREIFDSQLGSDFLPEVAGPINGGKEGRMRIPMPRRTAGLRSAPQPGGRGGREKIEKARDPRHALRRLLPLPDTLPGGR